MGHVEEKVEIILSPQGTYIVSSTIIGITDIIPWFVSYMKLYNMHIAK